MAEQRARRSERGAEEQGQGQPGVREQAAAAPESQPGAQSGGPEEGGAAGGGSTARQLDESRGARQQADQGADPAKGRVPLPGTDLEPGGEVGTQEQPLAGVAPFGVAQAGGEEAHAALVASDPHVYASMPGQSGVEAVGSGAPILAEAQDAMAARANAGIPEPPKVGPVPNVTLLDTPGGYQVVPAGVSPEDLPAEQASVRPQRGNYPQPPYGVEAGADNQVVAGPGSE